MLDTFLGWFVVAIPFLVTVGATMLAIKLPSERHYRKFLWGSIVAGILFSALAYWQQLRVLQQSIKDRKDSSAEVRKTVREEDQKVIDTLNATISSLTTAVSTQQASINDIHDSDLISGKKPVKVIVQNPAPAPPPQGSQSPAAEPGPDIRVASLPAPPNPKNGKNAIQFILTTNKVMDGGHVLMHCSNPFNEVSAVLSGAGVMMFGGQGGKMDDKTYISTIQSPNWSPRLPLVLTVYYDETDLGNCIFRPQQ